MMDTLFETGELAKYTPIRAGPLFALTTYGYALLKMKRWGFLLLLAVRSEKKKKFKQPSVSHELGDFKATSNFVKLSLNFAR
jgi:hypothetical protein